MKTLSTTSRSKRILAVAGAGTAVAGLVMIAAPGAWATDVTNPAQHPYPVTVTIDGQTYHDGQDTLPGYDDTACTAIPNVQYDFGSNEIDYYDDDGNLLKTAPWTEWSRISSYATWKAQQSGSSGSSSSSSTGSGSSSGSGTKTHTGTSSGTATHSSSGAKGGVKSSSSHASAGASASSSPTDTAIPTDAATDPASAAVVKKAKKGAAVAVSTDPSASPSAQSADAVAPVTENLSSSVKKGIGAGTGNTREAGFAVLAALAIASAVVWLTGLVRGRRARWDRTEELG
jgi:hypothetical protein